MIFARALIIEVTSSRQKFRNTLVFWVPSPLTFRLASFPHRYFNSQLFNQLMIKEGEIT